MTSARVPFHARPRLRIKSKDQLVQNTQVVLPNGEEISGVLGAMIEIDQKKGWIVAHLTMYADIECEADRIVEEIITVDGTRYQRVQKPKGPPNTEVRKGGGMRDKAEETS